MFDNFTNYIVICILRRQPYSPLLLRLDPAQSLTFHIFMLCYIKYSLHRTPVRTLRHRKVVISSRQLFLSRDDSQITKPADQGSYDYYHRYQEPRPVLQLLPEASLMFRLAIGGGISRPISHF